MAFASRRRRRCHFLSAGDRRDRRRRARALGVGQSIGSCKWSPAVEAGPFWTVQEVVLAAGRVRSPPSPRGIHKGPPPELRSLHGGAALGSIPSNECGTGGSGT